MKHPTLSDESVAGLRFIVNAKPCAMAQAMQDELGFSQRTVHNMAARLKKKGLVYRKPGFWGYWPTPAGRRFIEAYDAEVARRAALRAAREKVFKPGPYFDVSVAGAVCKQLGVQ